MKKIALLFTILCAGALNGMESHYVSSKGGTIHITSRGGSTTVIGGSSGGSLIKGSGVLASKKIAFSGVNKIIVGGVGILIITQDDKKPETLAIEADNNILPLIKTSVAKNTLEINMEGNIQPIVPVKYHVSLKNLSHIEVSGAVTVQLSKALKTKVLNIIASGSTGVTGTINAEKLDADVSGSSKLVLSGSASTQNLTTSGSSSFNGANLKGKKAIVNESGSSTISVNVSDAIDGQLSGASTLKYLNNPTIKARSSEASSIQKG